MSALIILVKSCDDKLEKKLIIFKFIKNTQILNIWEYISELWLGTFVTVTTSSFSSNCVFVLSNLFYKIMKAKEIVATICNDAKEKIRKIIL